ncbi:spore germination protein [Paenibacillus flagellatus]|uniref:Spore gernimation protein GerPA n=1 Tax=Paenibacillus flagellatus TaxID=2211139 RepID=A0A2V5KZT6_9BACL|nr:spore germination protein [Paenibacillus flagellatus]PYI55736.1 spore gernimation protein GerPA [Paenibacillus flagellatus]
MPAIVGSIKILSVGPSSIVHIGDSLQLAPQSTSKTFAGAGSFNTGDGVRTYNAVNLTNTYDGDIADSNALSIDKAGVPLP